MNYTKKQNFEMVMKRFQLLQAAYFIVLLFLSDAAYTQYLRDSTRFVGLENFYPENDLQVFSCYSQDEQYPITLDADFSIPNIPVNFDDESYPFVFDFGNSGNITLTTAIAPFVDFKITDTTYTYTPDGQIRGQMYQIEVSEFITLNRHFSDEAGSLSDWSIYSSFPFNGLIGLKYLDGRCFTLSYPRKVLAISDQSVMPEIETSQASIIQLEQYEMHPYGIHFKGCVNGRNAIIYLDTGKSHSAVNQSLFQPDDIFSDKSGSFFGGTVEITMGYKTFEIYYPRVKNTGRDIESELPVGIEIGSDILQYFLLTVDRTDGQNLLIIH
jgi:hypothetical protein